MQEGRKSINMGPAKMPRSIRNVRRPRYVDSGNSEEVSDDESTDAAVHEYLKDEYGAAADYGGCNTSELLKVAKNCYKLA